ncbi:transglutaminase domain-containing protein [Clostridium aestuarii]|uniref:Transglutaminase domain-containing protein n=1 Tax=Clostridium aestuarii TaxID=338193 RepID=A0ABT4D4S2_9CLOT|nr:transglutaminase domain-containing protein [Clostridium aestuarii]MCY6485200.1 transglutaminase domain-containing protein [Clostridium aestuarii]
MKRKKSTIILIWILIALGFVIGIKIRNYKDDTGLKVVKWDNFYDGKNINFYYVNDDKTIFEKLKREYKLEDIISKGNSDFEKSVELLKWVNQKLNYSNKKNGFSSYDGAEQILKKSEESNKNNLVSDDECSIVYNEVSNAIGVISRIGEFMISDEKNEKYRSFKVCEIWSDKYNKWIMIDPSNGCYLLDKDIPVSAVEIIKKGIEGLKVVGTNKPEKYKKNMKKYFCSYAVGIDNNIYGISKSNTYICFVKNKDSFNVPIEIVFNHPFIFTDKERLFTLSPRNKYIDDKSDKIPTLIFSKKTSKDNKNIEYYGAVFKNSIMVEKFYVSINGSLFKEVNNYFQFELKPGINDIKLSSDGKNIVRQVVFQYNIKE